MSEYSLSRLYVIGVIISFVYEVTAEIPPNKAANLDRGYIF